MQIYHLSFQKFSGGYTPGPSQPEGATPSRTQHRARPLAGRGAQAPWSWDTNLGPLNFLAVAAPLIRNHFPGPLSHFYAAPPHWLLVWRRIVSKSTIYLHRVPKKTKQICFCQNFVKFPLISIILGRKMGNDPNICEVHSFSTSPNLRHHLTSLPC